MKAKDAREFEFWDPELDETFTKSISDWELLNNPPYGHSLSDYKDVVIRVLLEVCGVDPDKYVGLRHCTAQEAHDLRDLVLEAVEKKNA